MRLAWAGAVLGLMAGAALAVSAPQAALVVRMEGVQVLALPVAMDERIGLRFIHSVDGLPVEDWYEVRPEGLVQVETRFLSFGTGMGHIPGQGRAVEDGVWLRVIGLERPIGTLHLRVGDPEVDHRLLYRQTEIRLSPHWAGKALVLGVERLPWAWVGASGWGDGW